MIRLSLMAGACAVLAGCGVGTSDSSSPAAVCTAMLADDPEVIGDLSEEGATIDDYCGCFEQVLASETEDDRLAILKAGQIVADIREDEDVGLEDAAGLLVRDVMQSGMTEGGTPSAYGVSQAEFETIGEYIDKIRGELQPGGACTAD